MSQSVSRQFSFIQNRKIVRRIFICLLSTLWISCTSDQTRIIEPAPDQEGPLLTNEQLLDLVQKQTLNYFWQNAEPNSGMARERYHEDEPDLDKHLVTTGGTGFGIMAILVGIKRNFISRIDGYNRIQKIVNFLEAAPRFHGVWSHWLNGATGEVVPFSRLDNGGDIVETAFLVQGLLCARQYFRTGNQEEQKLAEQIDQLWQEIEWNFYQGPEQEHELYWHWSPNHGWEINFKIHGYNETLIAFVLGASSPTHPLQPEVYHMGWAQNGQIRSEHPDTLLPLFHQGNHELGGPLFWAHYSFLGLDPRNLKDEYTDYLEHNIIHSLLNRQHCIDNPGNFQGYGPECWGLTASYSMDFYAAHSPQHDLGVIAPTAALSSFPYTPEASMQAMRHFYEELGSKIWGAYGFYDAFSIHNNWYPKRYLAIDQGPIIIMIENYRSQFLWDLFMSSPEIKDGLHILGFQNN